MHAHLFHYASIIPMDPTLLMSYLALTDCSALPCAKFDHKSVQISHFATNFPALQRDAIFLCARVLYLGCQQMKLLTRQKNELGSTIKKLFWLLWRQKFLSDDGWYKIIHNISVPYMLWAPDSSAMHYKNADNNLATHVDQQWQAKLLCFGVIIIIANIPRGISCWASQHTKYNAPFERIILWRSQRSHKRCKEKS